MAEGERIERSRRLRTGLGLASRPIATLATFQALADGVGIEPTRPGSLTISVFKTGALPLCQPSVLGASCRNRTRIHGVEARCAIHCTKDAEDQRLSPRIGCGGPDRTGDTVVMSHALYH